MSEFEMLHLNREETKVYHILLVSGQLLAGEIREACQLSQSELLNAINSLKQKKLVREVPGINGNYAALLPVSNLKTKVENSVKRIDLLSQQFNDEKTRVLENLKNSITGLTDAIKTSSEKEKSNIENNIARINENLADSKSSLVSTTDKFLQSQKNTIGSQIDNVTSQKSTSMSELNASINQMIQSINTSFTQLVYANKTMLEELGGSLHNGITPVDMEPFRKSMEDSKHSISNLREEFSTSLLQLSTATEQAHVTMKQKIEEQIGIIQVLGDNYTKDIENIVNTFTKSIQEFTEQSRQEIGNLQVAIDEKHEGTINLVKDTQFKNDGLYNGINEQLTNLFGQAAEMRDTQKTKLISQITDTEAGMNTMISNADTSITSQVTAIGGEINESIKNELTVINTQLSNQLNETIKSVNKSIENFSAELSSKLIARQNEISSEKDQKIVEIRENMQAQISSIRSDLEAIFTSIHDNDKSTFGRVLGDVETSKNETNTVISNAIEQLRGLKEEVKKLCIAFSNHLEVIQSQTSQKVHEFQNNHNVEFEERFVQVMNSIIQQVNQALVDLSQSVENDINTLQTSSNSLETSTHNRLDNDAERVQASLDAIYAETKKNYQEAISKASAAQLDLLSKFSSSNDEQMERVREEFNRIHESLNSKLDETLQQLRESFNQSVDKIGGESENFINSTNAEMISQVSSLRQAVFQEIDRAQHLVGKANSMQEEEIKVALDDFTNSFNDTSTQIKEPTSALVKMLAVLEGELDHVETPTSTTKHVIGRDTIVEHMNDMISRIKSKATILVPSISMVTEEVIMQLKATSQVTIISYIDEVADKDWIDRMHGARANITLRSITGSAGTGTLPDFIGFEREGEEILLGTMDEGAKDYVAIVSSSEYFVKTLGNIVISDYSRGRSKQIAK